MKLEIFTVPKYGYHVFMIAFLLIFSFYIEQVGGLFPNNKEKMDYVHFVGTYQKTESAQPRKLAKTDFPDGKTYSQIIIKGHFDQQVPKGVKLYMFMSSMRVQMWKNAKRIFTYGERESLPSIIKSAGREWAYYQSEGIEVHDQIEIHIQLVYRNNGKSVYQNFLSSFCIGERYTLLTEQLKKYFLKIIISFIVFVMGLLFLVFLMAFRHMNIPIAKGSVSCGMLMLTGGACTLIDYKCTTLLLENGIFIMIFDYVLQLLIGGFLLLNLKNYLISAKFIKAANIFVYIWSGLAGLYFILQGTGKADGQELILDYISVLIIMIVIILILLVVDLKKHSDKKIKELLYSCIVLTAACIIEVLHFAITKRYWIIVLEAGLFCFTAGQTRMLLIYTKQNYEKGKRADELEKELVQSRIAVMLSQIQPHFLYNTLTSIQELCLMDPEKAHQAITWFSQFLRGNMDSLSTTELIPFEKELNHVKNYLKLEKVRFGDLLEAEYDIQVKNFKVPALCIQPIVENAVRHGIVKQEKPGTVSIHTYEDAHGIHIIVMDNGRGMKFDKDRNIVIHDNIKKTHIGIENVRRRIKEQCSGTLDIVSEEGKGTQVKISIPRQNAEKF
ncbi:sensor histidine kinase [[Clostridium] polysaccharolyticum]|uniref:Histidine kinase-, DNA gyrase B-, and HSP90-like ATPase n=1 Tax=[Clostridium] polysaccharolyticum TaxID=29364 RepID=A0A1I0G4Q0_9FIRM|nr:histidine kinase [[Clostridium] polysaccharolyticum]SET65730.1 Histidine kinase-, DNA gyrase B-, and HSP90-like ATPase [[Clostridium] polysaccharolyticum]